MEVHALSILSLRYSSLIGIIAPRHTGSYRRAFAALSDKFFNSSSCVIIVLSSFVVPPLVRGRWALVLLFDFDAQLAAAASGDLREGL
jgi:hypothetical protein